MGKKFHSPLAKFAIYVSHDLVDFIRATVLLFKIYVLSSRERIFSINFFFVRYICSQFSRKTNFKFDIFTDIILLFYILIVTYQFMSKVVWDLKTTWILEHAGCRDAY